MRRESSPGAAAREYHAATCMTVQRAFARPDLLLAYTPDPENSAYEFKEYRGAPRVALPVAAAFPRGRPRGVDVLAGQRTNTGDADLLTVARLLAFSAGVTRILERDGRRLYYLAVSSAHSYPDLYVICGDLPGLRAGVYYFHPLTLELVLLRTGDFRAALASAAAEDSIRTNPISIVLGGVPWRAVAYRDSYREHSLRHVYWDVGGLLANMVPVSEASGLSAQVLLGFVDAEVAALVGLDQVHQFPVAIATFDRRENKPGACPAPAERSTAPQPSAGGVAEPVMSPAPDSPIAAKEPVLFPFMVEAHRAGDLADPAAVAAWRAGRAATAAASWPFPVRAPALASEMPLEEVILRRGSARRMRDQCVARELLEWGLAVACRPVPGDWAGNGRGLLEHFAVVHNVDGVEPGLYRWLPGGLSMIRAGDFREAARHVSMGQGQAGDGAYVTFHCANLDRVLSGLGSRGYRAAQVEAGWVLERLHLAVYAIGAGATGLAFLDGEASELLGTRAAVMTEVAVGMPAYRARPGALGADATRIAGRAIDSYFARLRELNPQRSDDGQPQTSASRHQAASAADPRPPDLLT